MIDYAKALQRLLERIHALPSERVPLTQVSGRILAKDIVSPMALPSFDHAAMDGYALSACEGLPANSEHVVSGSQAAGDGARDANESAWEIMTGARLPDGLDAVARLEATQLLEVDSVGMPERIRLIQPLAARSNVRLGGSDVTQGATVVRAGTRIESAHVMLLAALGISDVDVVQRPRVAIICTGKELQADLDRPLAVNCIYNSNGPYLVAALQVAGADVISCVTVDDTAITYATALQDAVDAKVDLVVSTGAVSMGRYDFVPDVLQSLGAEVLFHHVAIRPGKPLLCAQLARGPVLLALPGTPMAVAAGMRFFVGLALRAMVMQLPEPTVMATLDTPLQAKSAFRHFLLATLHLDQDGRLHASVLERQQPFRIHPFTQAHGWVVLPAHTGDCAAGTLVQVHGLDVGHMPDLIKPHELNS